MIILFRVFGMCRCGSWVDDVAEASRPCSNTHRTSTHIGHRRDADATGQAKMKRPRRDASRALVYAMLLGLAEVAQGFFGFGDAGALFAIDADLALQDFVDDDLEIAAAGA